MRGVPRFWLKAFWGFEPIDEGYFGFTKEWARKRFLKGYQNGDMILIYGADVATTATVDRRQVLGILEVEPLEIWDTDKISDKGLADKKRMGWESNWRFAVPVRRAWRLNRRVSVKDMFPDTYVAERGRVLGSLGELVTDREARNVMGWPAIPVSVFGEPPVPAEGALELEFGNIYEPSLGVTPTYGLRTADHVDDENFLYLMQIKGDLAALLGKQSFELIGRCLVKVGHSNDVDRRLTELNVGFPESSRTRWTKRVQSRAFPNGAAAKAAEDRLKAAFDRIGQSQGGEFFLCIEKTVDSTFARIAGDMAFKLTAPKKVT